MIPERKKTRATALRAGVASLLATFVLAGCSITGPKTIVTTPDPQLIEAQKKAFNEQLAKVRRDGDAAVTWAVCKDINNKELYKQKLCGFALSGFSKAYKNDQDLPANYVALVDAGNKVDANEIGGTLCFAKDDAINCHPLAAGPVLAKAETDKADVSKPEENNSARVTEATKKANVERIKQLAAARGLGTKKTGSKTPANDNLDLLTAGPSFYGPSSLDIDEPPTGPRISGGATPPDNKATIVASATPDSSSAAQPPKTTLLSKVKTAAPSVVAGAATSLTVKALLAPICAQFVAAAAATTLPAFAAALVVPVAAVAVTGAIAGGLAGIARARFSKGPKQKGWKFKAFKKGALWGVIGGAVFTGIGEIIANDLRPGSFFHDLFSSPQEATQQTHEAASQAKEAVKQVAGSMPSPDLDVKSLVSADQLKGLPEDVQRLADSKDPAKIVKFCKEASYHLINDDGYTQASRKAGANLIEKGMDFARIHGVHTTAADQLAKDELNWLRKLPEATRKAFGLGRNLLSPNPA